MPHIAPSNAEDQPPDSVELDALRVLVEAYIAAEGPKKGQRLLKAAADVLERREFAATVVDFLPAEERAARQQTRRRTAAWFRMCLPAWFIRLDKRT